MLLLRVIIKPKVKYKNGIKLQQSGQKQELEAASRLKFLNTQCQI